jgi:hypothetical protein
VENKFDSKEGRATTNATQCAVYAQRARLQFGQISYAMLFTTKTGIAAAGDSGFAAVGYKQLAEAVTAARDRMKSTGRWEYPDASMADRFAHYLVDTFLRHIDSLFPDDDVRAALRKLGANERPAGISSAWLASHPNVQEIAACQEKALDRWDLDAMRAQLAEQGATEAELQALDAIFEWGEQFGECDFQASGKASFVIRIPTCGDDVRILTVQGRMLRFYWGHFIGGYDETKRPNRNYKKFPHAYELAEYYCQRLNTEFGWSLEVLKPEDGFCEPSRPLADISAPSALARFIEILGDVAASAVTGNPRQLNDEKG